MAFVDYFAAEQMAGAKFQNAIIAGVDGYNPNTPALTATGAGAWLNVRGINGGITVEIAKTGTGTCHFTVDGTFDPASTASGSSIVYAGLVRYGVLGSGGALTIVVGDTTVGAGTVNTVIAVVDAFPTIRVSINNVSGTVSVKTRMYLAPQ